MITRLRSAAAYGFFAFLIAAGSARGETLVVPSNLAAAEGNLNNSLPFNVETQRYQQVYAAGEFAGRSGAVQITEIAFRPDGPLGRPFTATLPYVQLSLSTTWASPDRLSFYFADNAGQDATVVYEGPLALSSAATGPVRGPKDFDIRIPLARPFLYNPEAGNLLLEVRNFAGGITTSLDAHLARGDSSSRLYTYDLPVESELGYIDTLFSIALVTEFTLVDPSLPVAVDVKPAACPNIVNVGARGVLPVALVGTPTFDVQSVDAASVRLAGVPALRSAFEDAAAEFAPYVGKTLASDCSEAGPDGIIDLSLKFEVQEIVLALESELGRELVDGEVLVVKLAGNLRAELGGGAIQGEDVLVVHKKPGK